MNDAIGALPAVSSLLFVNHILSAQKDAGNSTDMYIHTYRIATALTFYDRAYIKRRFRCEKCAAKIVATIICSRANSVEASLRTLR